MTNIQTISDYLKHFAAEIGERVVQQFPALHTPGDAPSPLLQKLKRTPFPGQELVIMGIAKAWQHHSSASAIAECGTGKTLIALASIFVCAKNRPFTALAMVPPQLVTKWARECFQTIPGIRVFVIDGMRNSTKTGDAGGINEVRLRSGKVQREGLRTTLGDLRLAKQYRSSRERWRRTCPESAIFIVSRERAKLGYYWRHAHRIARSGRYHGCVVNADTGRPVLTGEDQLRTDDFRKAKHSETVVPDSVGPEKSRKQFFSALWQADGKRIRRMAPIDFMGRYMKGFFDFAIADEVHELANDTAQGQALGTMAAIAKRTLALTGTYSTGYADSAFNNLFRLHPQRMIAAGFEHSSGGLRTFAETYGVLEKVTVVEPADNRCSEARVTKQVKRRPGVSPLLFGHYLLDTAAFLSLEDISEALPSYREEVISVEMDPPLAEAYTELQDDIKESLEKHRNNGSVLSVSMNALLLYPDRPFRMGDLIAHVHDKETGHREKILISTPRDLDEAYAYAKERRLVDEVKNELRNGRKCQIFAVYTQKRDVTQRLKQLLLTEGIRTEILTTEIAPERREAWYEEKLRSGMQVCIAHPRLVMTGLDLLEMPTIIFYETGYSTHVLRQASRRSWRIGQRKPVRVCYMTYGNTAQESCLRLMGKKVQVSLALEGKLASCGLTSSEDDDDMLTALARELVTQRGIGESAAAVWRSLRSQISTPEPAPVTIEHVAAPAIESEPLFAQQVPLRKGAVQLSFQF